MLPTFAALAGVWVREVNYEPRDVVQDSRARDGSHVFWGQAPTGAYVDVRCIMAEAMTPRGFAGTLAIEPATPAEPGTFRLTWTRLVDTKPASCPSGVDSSNCRVVVGTVAAPEVLMEEGDGFLEVWRRVVAFDGARGDAAEDEHRRIRIGPALFESGADFVAVSGLTPAPLRTIPSVAA